MKTVLHQTPPVVEEWLRERRRIGADTHDEMWDGVYHVAPAPTPQHADLQFQSLHVTRGRLDKRRYRVVGDINVGTKTNYRVPDGAVLEQLTSELFVSTAALVVEVLSPSDQTWHKLDHYVEHGVQEMIVVDPEAQRVTFLRRGESTMVRAPSSELLGLSASEFEALLEWPPLV
ncbi:Uma2 family endonuclease [Euzebya tangerina]|uniref:Uma2 family endonuclease n=1 Tax=Euzebya tangerina TaxID=591198 RepID=UPI000E315972|nr:Uma2 family endonuclease [Euzebya tangerina]